MPDRRVPASTYRLQLTSDFGFGAAAELAGYLAGLGVTHVYLSPILQAVPGSRHGYDVIDHARVSADLGGADEFRAMVRRFREHELGVVVDIVPNHMAIPVPESGNRQLCSVLAEGTGSPYAHWFDIDWAVPGGRFLLPILAGPPEDCRPDLSVADGPVLRYHEHVLPLRPGTERLPIRELLDAQHYELADWRDASTRLNWRRFFDVTPLIAIRVEDPDVFAASHQVLFRLFAEGLIDGLRVDHPDGLADPRGYLRRLADATGGAWVVAEKILARDERPPADWPCAGTTGYDALPLVDGLFVDPAGAAPLAQVYAEFTGAAQATFAEVAAAAKHEIAERAFAAEVGRLVRLLGTEAGDAADLRTVLVELLAAFGVYRAYVHPGEPPADPARHAIEAAASRARRRLPERLHGTLDAVAEAVLGAGPAELVVRFQQTTGPVLAKGVEDTACYRWLRLTSLNEVGGDPDRFGVSPAEFDLAARHLACAWPGTLTTLSTHDTKRQEDVRARLAVLAEDPGAWAREVADWAEAAGGDVDRDAAYLIWQTLAGAWPITEDRLAGYLTKALREAKTRTSWTAPDAEYESAVLDFAGRLLADPRLTGRIDDFGHRIAPAARANSLGAKLVQLTMPGVPDVYQGCELGAFSLVDPDNRRPVDFDCRRRMLATLDREQAGAPGTFDAEKLLVVSRALRLRRDNPGWFGGSYTPLPAAGPAAEHVVAFARGGPDGGAAVTVATRLPAGLSRRGGWAGTELLLDALPPQRDGWHDVLTGDHHSGPRPRLAELTRRLPVALLVPARNSP